MKTLHIHTSTHPHIHTSTHNFIYVAFITLFLISCQKNPLEKTQPESSLEVANPHNVALIQQASDIAFFPEIVNENGILHFSNLEHYNATLEQLALMENQWVDEYVPSESDHIIPDEALEAFEDMLEFYSLRKFIEQDEDVFLRSGNENWAERLEVTHFIKDDYVRTVLNPSAEIIIGNSVFKYVTNEVIVEITDGNMNTLEVVRNYFASQDDIITTVPAGMGGGNVILHYPNFSVPIIVTGPSVETCPSTAFELLLQWDASDKSAMDLSVGLSDNVSSILAMNSGLLASQFDLLVSNVDGSNLTPIFSSANGYMGNYTHIFNNPGAYMICLTQKFTDQNGSICTIKETCDTVVTGSCCQANDKEYSDANYANNQRKFEAEFEVVNNFFSHKLWTKTKNFSRKSNGTWKQEKADIIEAGIVGGTGGSVYYKKNALGQCNIPIAMNGYNYNASEIDKKKITYSFSVPHSHGTKKFYVHSETVASFHNVEDNNDTESGILRLTDNCN